MYGCVYNNFPLAVGESFFVGCIKRCRCANGNRIVCSDRCKKEKKERGENCVRVTDPEDPQCCHRWLCTEEDVEPISPREIAGKEIGEKQRNSKSFSRGERLSRKIIEKTQSNEERHA